MTHKKPPPTSVSSDKLLQTPTSETEMDDMFLEYNTNTIYVLNTTYRYGEFDMIGLFGSAAGRAIVNKQQQQQQQQRQQTTTTVPAKTTANTPLKSNTNNHLTHKKTLSKMTAKSKSLDYEIHVDDHERDTNNTSKNNLAKIHEKKSKFWKLFESEKIKNSLEDISTSSSKNSVSKSIKSTRKSSKELYREAAQLLGLSCTLSDNCRCLDCQSGYFDCDDDSDSMSDFDMSCMDELEANFVLSSDNLVYGGDDDDDDDDYDDADVKTAMTAATTDEFVVTADDNNFVYSNNYDDDDVDDNNQVAADGGVQMHPENSQRINELSMDQMVA